MLSNKVIINSDLVKFALLTCAFLGYEVYERPGTYKFVIIVTKMCYLSEIIPFASNNYGFDPVDFSRPPCQN